MKLTRKAIREYSREVTATTRAAADRTEELLRGFMRQHPDATVAQTRDYARAAVAKVAQEYGNAAGQVAMQFFDGVMEAEGVPTLGASLYDGPDSVAISRGAHYQARWLDDPNPNPDRFVEGMRELTEYHVRRAANLTAIDNVERTSEWARTGKRRQGRASLVRYARVPTGGETCTFCTMLASRGFVYHTADSAGEADHRKCDCLIVPGVKGQTSIDGYDERTLYSVYRAFLDIDQSKLTDADGNELKGNARAAEARRLKQEAKERILGRADWDGE